MRIYHIYKQTAKPVRPHNGWSEYRWMPYEYIGYVTGTKELYNVMQKFLYCDFPYYNKPEITKYFEYSTMLFRKRHGCSIFDISYNNILKNEPVNKSISTNRYAIVDDKGNFQDNCSLVKKHKKRRRYGYYKYATQTRTPRYASRLRNTVTPEELVELKENYNYTPPSKYLNGLDVPYHYKVSKRWKDQTKRKHQWKYN